MRDSEGDRHLPEDVARLPLADHALLSVDVPDGLDPTLEQSEQRALAALVHGVLAGAEADVSRDPTQPLEILRPERLEDGDRGELCGRHHARTPTATIRASPCFVPMATKQRYCVGPQSAGRRSPRKGARRRRPPAMRFEVSARGGAIRIAPVRPAG